MAQRCAVKIDGPIGPLLKRKLGSQGISVDSAKQLRIALPCLSNHLTRNDLNSHMIESIGFPLYSSIIGLGSNFVGNLIDSKYRSVVIKTRIQGDSPERRCLISFNSKGTPVLSVLIKGSNAD